MICIKIDFPNIITHFNINLIMNNPQYRLKNEYGLEEETPTQRYEREYKERREQAIKSGLILTPEDRENIISIIKHNFSSKPYFESDKLTDEFVNIELNIVVKHVKIKHSDHMDTLYSLDNYYKIKRIIGNKTL